MQRSPECRCTCHHHGTDLLLSLTMTPVRRLTGPSVLCLAAVLAACSGGGHKAAAETSTVTTDSAPPAQETARRPALDWTRFGYDAARTNNAPRGLTAAQVARLKPRTIGLPG